MKITEHLVFAALMVPTFLVLAAAAVSLGHPDPKVLTANAAPVLIIEHLADPGPF
ncbi:MAG: hypothetical protein ACT4P4_05420 [Betaproteobacteria bacterium]